MRTLKLAEVVCAIGYKLGTRSMVPQVAEVRGYAEAWGGGGRAWRQCWLAQIKTGSEMFLSDGEKDDPVEQEAEKFASAILVPPNHQPEVAALRTKAQVLRLADDLGISAGVVVGQYQHMTKNFRWLNDLKRKFVWAE